MHGRKQSTAGIRRQHGLGTALSPGSGKRDTRSSIAMFAHASTDVATMGCMTGQCIPRSSQRSIQYQSNDVKRRSTLSPTLDPELDATLATTLRAGDREPRSSVNADLRSGASSVFESRIGSNVACVLRRRLPQKYPAWRAPPYERVRPDHRVTDRRRGRYIGTVLSVCVKPTLGRHPCTQYLGDGRFSSSFPLAACQATTAWPRRRRAKAEPAPGPLPPSPLSPRHLSKLGRYSTSSGTRAVSSPLGYWAKRDALHLLHSAIDRGRCQSLPSRMPLLGPDGSAGLQRNKLRQQREQQREQGREQRGVFKKRSPTPAPRPHISVRGSAVPTEYWTSGRAQPGASSTAAGSLH